MYRGIILCVFFLPLISRGQEYKVNKDTIKPIIVECDENQFNGFYNISGIYISTFYRIIDSISIYINADKKLDKILVLSPINQEDKNAMPCLKIKKNRLLVVLVSVGSKYKIDFINPDAILNSYDYMYSPFRSIKKINKGIRFLFEYGSIINYQYEFDFIIKRNSLFLSKRKYWAFNKSNPGLERDKTDLYLNNNYNLKDIKMQNFLVNISDLLEKNSD